MQSLRFSILTTLALLLLSASAHAQLVGGQWETTWQFDGQANDTLGWAVSSAGDVNGDGFDDVIVGAHYADPGGLADAGSAYVYSGATGTLIWQFDGQAAFDWFGESVSGAGDVDGDGIDDVIVGAYYAEPGGLVRAGSAYVYSGATGTLIWQFDGQAWGDQLGSSVSGAGDADGDGFDDVVVGAPGADPGGNSHAGSTYVYSGATGTVIWQSDGQAANDQRGLSVSDAGDVDGDGFDDVIVGAPYAGGSFRGSAYVYSGATGALIWQFNGQASSDWLGHSVSDAGDVDGDGFDDVIVGAQFTDPGGMSAAGSAYVYSGATGSLIWQFDGQAGSDYLGWSVSGAGDVDRDGFDDVIVGAPAYPGGFGNGGAAYVYSGATGTVIWQFDGQASSDYFGLSVSGAGDVDGDGLDDVIVGAPEADPGGIGNAGSAYVYSFNPLLHLDATEISHSANPPVQFTLDFPASEAGARFAILLSTGGTGPMVRSGLEIPLTPNLHFYAALGNSALHGTLNVHARAQLSLDLPSQIPVSSVGNTIYFAAVTLDAVTQWGRMSSIARTLTIVP